MCRRFRESHAKELPKLFHTFAIILRCYKLVRNNSFRIRPHLWLTDRCSALRCDRRPRQFGKAIKAFSRWVAHHYFNLPLRYIGFGGEGKQVRDLLHIQDLCELIGSIVNSLREHSGDVLNVGGGIERSISLMELTELCRRVVGNAVATSGISDTAGFDVPLYVSDCRKLFTRSDGRPKRSRETLVADIYQWIRANERMLKPIFT